jgi:hypothetical protein
MTKYYKLFIVCIVLAFFSIFGHADEVINGKGVVDKFQLANNGKTFSITGWAATEENSSKIISLAVYFGEQSVYKGTFNRLERPDVAQAFGRPNWLLSGWETEFDLPPSVVKGDFSIHVIAESNTGNFIRLSNDPNFTTVKILEETSVVYSSLIAVSIALFLLVLLVVYRYCTECFFRDKFKIYLPVWGIPFITVVSTFFVLVFFGVTGSSLSLALKSSPLIGSDELPIAGAPRAIRSDEWLVFTPLAIAQFNHEPKFPIINTNLGSEGQNMMILGMTGVPIAHISGMARPANWGFHLFDLKRGLAWYWWFPIFSCFIALWAVFVIVLNGQHRLSLGISAAFVLSPYVIGWSYWPAYVTMFPAASFVLGIYLLKGMPVIRGLLASIFLGLFLSGFVLVLYPAWQVPLGYLFLVLFLAVVLRDGLLKKFNGLKLTYFSLSALIAVIILISWWLDAKDAIHTLVSTVYPGQRVEVRGGYIEPWYFIKGITNIFSMFNDLKGYPNQSEIASFVYFSPPLLIAAGLAMWRLKNFDGVTITLIGFIGFVLVFQFLGLPNIIAKYSFWGRSTPSRADLALGMAQLMLLAAWINLFLRMHEMDRKWVFIRSSAAIILWCAFIGYSFLYVAPKSAIQANPAVLCAAIITMGVLGYWLIRGAFENVLILTCFWGLSIASTFHPLSFTPSFIKADLHSCNANNKEGGMVVTLGSQVPAMSFLAAGVHVINGILYYPQFALWKIIDPTGNAKDIYNRYQHLIFVPGSIDGLTHRIELPQADVVKIIFDIERFDFKRIGVSCIYGEEVLFKGADKNNALKFIENKAGFSLYRAL